MQLLSGKFVLRVPPSLHRRLKEEARSTGQSLNALCVQKLRSTAGSCLPPGSTPDLGSAGECLPEIVRRWRLAGVVLFGSAARGEATQASDVDLLLVVGHRANISPALYRQWDEWQAGKPSSIAAISPQFVRLPASVSDAGGLWYEIAIEGRILWERDFQVSGFLRAIREAMACGAIRRGTLHGSPYWVKEFGGADA